MPRRAEHRPPTPRRAADADGGSAAFLRLLTGADEHRRVTTLAAVVGRMGGPHKAMVADMLVGFLRRAAPAKRAPAVESLAGIGPEAAGAIVGALCDARNSKQARV